MPETRLHSPTYGIDPASLQFHGAWTIVDGKGWGGIANSTERGADDLPSVSVIEPVPNRDQAPVSRERGLGHLELTDPAADAHMEIARSRVRAIQSRPGQRDRELEMLETATEHSESVAEALDRLDSGEYRWRALERLHGAEFVRKLKALRRG